MIAPRLLMVLRRTVCFAQDLSRVTGDFRACRCQAFSKKPVLGKIDATAKQPRPKTVPVPKIKLHLPNNAIIVTVLEDAQRIAKRRNLILVETSKIDDKTQRPIYKLVNNSSFLEESEENVVDTSKIIEKSKETRIFYINAKIAEYDLRTKIKNMIKLLHKGHKIKVMITLDSITEDKTQSIIEDAVKNEGSIQQMRSKKGVILFLINPLLNKNANSSVDNKGKKETESNTVSQNNNV